MTPAVTAAKRAGISFTLHRYDHDPSNKDFGREAVDKLKVSANSVFKTLLVAINGNNHSLAVAVVPVGHSLDLKLMAKALGVKRVIMADKNAAQRSTGYLIGGISPLGQKQTLPIVIDQSAEGLSEVYVSGGLRGLEIALTPVDLVQLTKGLLRPISTR